MTASTSSRIHAELPLSGRQIRLLRVIPGDSTVRYFLDVVDLDPDNMLPYHALSYVWGSPDLVKTINVNGSELAITSSLSEALSYVLPYWVTNWPDRPRECQRLWVDAICIDQKSVSEKNHQVPMMGDIYRGAEMVISSLAPTDDSTLLAMDCINLITSEIAQLGGLENALLDVSWLVKHPMLWEPDHAPTQHNSLSGNRAWRAMGEMYGHRYWERLWIFQEVVLSRNCTFLCGNNSMLLASFETAYNWLARLSWAAKKPDFMTQKAWVQMTNHGQVSKWDCIHDIAMARSKNKSGHFREWPLVVSIMMANLAATNAKDYFYGALSLSGVRITPDYGHSTSIGRICCDFFKDVVGMHQSPRRSTNLEILCFSGIGCGWHQYDETPSWAPNIPGMGAVFNRPDHQFVQPIKSWGLSEDVTAGFSVEATDYDVAPELASLFRLEDKRLFVPGIVIDTVRELAPVDTETVFLMTASWISDFAKRHLNYATGISGFEAAVQLLVANHSPWLLLGPLTRVQETIKVLLLLANAHRLLYPNTSHHLKHLKGFLEDRGLTRVASIFGDLCRQNADPRPTQRTYSIDDAEGKDFYLAKQFFSLLQCNDSIQLRSLLIDYWMIKSCVGETAAGFLGYFPKNTMKEDLVCMFQVGVRPSVLRRSGDHFLHVGTCSLAGLYWQDDLDKFLQARYFEPKVFEIR